jgi:hypothetical protein
MRAGIGMSADVSTPFSSRIVSPPEQSETTMSDRKGADQTCPLRARPNLSDGLRLSSAQRHRIGQVMQLLQQQVADNDMQVLRRSTKTIIEMTTKIIGRKSLEKMTTKNPGPGSLLQRRRFSPKKHH